MTELLPRRIAWFAPWTWKRRWWIFGLLLVLIVYPSGIAPMEYFAFRGWVPYRLFEIVYAPIIFLADASPTFAKFIHMYMDLFSFG